MVCMTWPLVGNYGVNAQDMESGRVHPAALLVRECCHRPSNWRATGSLPDFLARNNVPGIEGLDTRALTRHLRLNGAMRGIVTTRETSPQELISMAQCLPSMEGQNLVEQVSPAKPWIWDGTTARAVDLRPDGSYAWAGRGVPVAVMDYGIKWNIVRLLEREGFEPLALPAGFSAGQVLATGAKALFLSNGPGDPAVLGKEIAVLRELAPRLPTAGICLGHQLLGLAFGARTYKLKFGHHGCNHPVKDLDTGRIEISSQNHGFCVDIDAAPDLRVTHIHLNDQTLEGFAHRTLPVIAVQHHPEACPGPSDCRGFFRRFRRMTHDAIGH
jgi:carbamoyl-phosphate synthase small subunit